MSWPRAWLGPEVSEVSAIKTRQSHQVGLGNASQSSSLHREAYRRLPTSPGHEISTSGILDLVSVQDFRKSFERMRATSGAQILSLSLTVRLDSELPLEASS